MQAWVPRLLPWCGVEAVVVRYGSDQRNPSARTDTLTVQTVLRGEGLSALPCSTAVFAGPRSPQPGALWCRRSIDDLLREVVGLRYGSSLHLLLNEIREYQAAKMQMRCRGYDHAADPALTSTVCCARSPAPIVAC